MPLNPPPPTLAQPTQVYASIAGDVVVASAYSHELPNYGLSVGLSNYSAAYCVGLLVARRVLTKFGLADTYTGQVRQGGSSGSSSSCGQPALTQGGAGEGSGG